MAAVLTLAIAALFSPPAKPSAPSGGLFKPAFHAPPTLALSVLGSGRVGESRAGLWRAATADRRVDLGELRGAPVVVNFWASWCAACVLEAPDLSNAAARFARRGVIFLGVNQEDSPGQARRYLRDLQVRYPNLTGAGLATARRWGVVGYPTTFFINARGVVVANVVGPASPAQLDAGATAALDAPPRGDARGTLRR